MAIVRVFPDASTISFTVLAQSNSYGSPSCFPGHVGVHVAVEHSLVPRPARVRLEPVRPRLAFPARVVVAIRVLLVARLLELVAAPRVLRDRGLVSGGRLLPRVPVLGVAYFNVREPVWKSTSELDYHTIEQMQL